MSNSIAPLLERDEVLAELMPFIDDAARSHGRLVFLGGEAGIGKTTLAAALTARAAGRLTVRRGACDNITTAAALGPLAEAAPDLAELIDRDVDANAGRLRLFRHLRTVLAGEPTLLLIEDVQWADEATVELLRYLGRRLADSPLLIVVTFRSDEVSVGHPVAVLRGDLATSAAVTRVDLTPLSVDGVGQLADAAGSPLDALELHRYTGGNPFYVTELLALGEQRLPASVRDAVLARASRLSAAAQRVLAAAAVLGQRTELGLLVEVSGEPGPAVDECVERGMLVGDHAGWAFRHELARLAVDQTLSPGARHDLHAAALRALRSRGVRDDRRLAHHAAGCGDAVAVLEHAPRSAARAARLGAHREAAEQYRLALRFADATTEAAAAVAGRLHEALAYECYLTDQHAEAKQARHAALEIWQRLDEPISIGTNQRWLSRLSWFLGLNDQAERFGAEAVATLEPLGSGHELAMAYSNLAQLRMLTGDVDATVEWGERAIALARGLDDREVEIHALNNIGTVLIYDAEAPEGHHMLARSLDLALAADAVEHVARAYTNLGAAAVPIRQLTVADGYLKAGIAYCTERDLDSWRLYMTSWQARSHLEQGRPTAAAECVGEVLRHAQVAAVTRISALVAAAQLAQRRGEEASALLDEALALAESTGERQRLVPTVAARAEAAWLADRRSDIVTEIDRVWDLAGEYPHRWELGELCWWLSLAGVRREPPVPVSAPFALMLAGQWSAAAQAWRAQGAVLWEAIALAHHPELGTAREAFDRLDAMEAPALRQALARDRHARGLQVPRGPRAASRRNPFQLTLREVEVLGLVAEGLTNAQVAERLFLSEKTVGHHVSAVLRKLGESTRARAVATALREGIVTPR